MVHTTESGSIAREHPRGLNFDPQARRRRARGRTLASSIGWLSLGLGLTELIAPGLVARTVGFRRPGAGVRNTFRAMGARELVTGLGLLVSVRQAPWLWLRVAGDVVDFALLGASMQMRRTDAARLGASMAAVAGVTALDAFAASRTRTIEQLPGAGADARTAVAVTTINQPPQRVYEFFRDFRNLPKFMAHIESIDVRDDQHSHWKVEGPGGIGFEWDAEIVEDRPGELIAWRSLPGADVENDGVVEFTKAPGDRGTEIHAEIHYRAPAGPLGVAIAKLFGRAPGQQARGDLRRLKQVLELGEVVHSDASIHRRIHAAQPPSERYLDYPIAEEAAQ